MSVLSNSVITQITITELYYRIFTSRVSIDFHSFFITELSNLILTSENTLKIYITAELSNWVSKHAVVELSIQQYLISNIIFECLLKSFCFIEKKYRKDTYCKFFLNLNSHSLINDKYTQWYAYLLIDCKILLL